MAINNYGHASDSLEIVTLQREVILLKASVSRLKQENGMIRDAFQQQQVKVDSLQEKQMNQAANMKALTDKIGTDLSKTKKNLEERTSRLSTNINNRTWMIICCIAIALILLFSSYFILKKKIKLMDSSVKTKIDEGSMELDSRLTGILNQVVGVQTNILNLNSNITALQSNTNNQLDHTLALKVADEIVRIETNLSRMDESVKGYKQLKKAVERIRTNFLANGYEIVEMLGKPYNEGMKVVANFVSDDTLGEGEQKITGIIKPQINYKGKMIQSAQITVSQNL